MTEKAEKEKKSGAKAGDQKVSKEPATQRSSNGSSSENGSNGDHGAGSEGKRGERPQSERREPPSAEDLKRYEAYVGQKWSGKCRWFNVMKGFGFIDPFNEEAKSNNDDVFVHQSALQMEGFRSLDENEEIEFTVSLGRNGLEAADVKGLNGAELRGSSIRPMGRRTREKLIRCYKCGKLGTHQASKCKSEIGPKACYHCHSTEHQVSSCPTYQTHKEAMAEERRQKGEPPRAPRPPRTERQKGPRPDSKKTSEESDQPKEVRRTAPQKQKVESKIGK